MGECSGCGSSPDRSERKALRESQRTEMGICESNIIETAPVADSQNHLDQPKGFWITIVNDVHNETGYNNYLAAFEKEFLVTGKCRAVHTDVSKKSFGSGAQGEVRIMEWDSLEAATQAMNSAEYSMVCAAARSPMSEIVSRHTGVVSLKPWFNPGCGYWIISVSDIGDQASYTAYVHAFLRNVLQPDQRTGLNGCQLVRGYSDYVQAGAIVSPKGNVELNRTGSKTRASISKASPKDIVIVEFTSVQDAIDVYKTHAYQQCLKHLESDRTKTKVVRDFRVIGSCIEKSIEDMRCSESY